MRESETQKLLVPLSFSKKSELALHFALTHTRGMKAVIYLFHVLETTTSNFRRLDSLNEELVERMKNTLLQAIESLRKNGIECDVEQVHRRISHGKAAPEIFQMANGIDADMIIMGAPTSRAFRRFVTKVPCTVVLMKDKNDI